MVELPAYLGGYPDEATHLAQFRDAASTLGAREDVAGESVQGRAIVRFEFGAAGGPVVLLTALIHAVEYIGSRALLGVTRALADGATADARWLRERARFVVLPVLNPDGHARVIASLARGAISGRRCNARSVDLNRNFPAVSSARSLHPAAGSRFRASPYYRGPAAFSEPESRAVRATVERAPPAVSVGFHSFGGLLLHPYSYTTARHARHETFARLGRAFREAQPARPYTVKQAIGLYPIVGGLDDWLDAAHGTLAFTLEVSRLELRTFTLRRLVNPFCWANPRDPGATVAHVVPAVIALLRAALDAPTASR